MIQFASRFLFLAMQCGFAFAVQLEEKAEVLFETPNTSGVVLHTGAFRKCVVFCLVSGIGW